MHTVDPKHYGRCVDSEKKKRHFSFIFFLLKIDSEEWNKSQGQTVLRTWEVESPHNYENNQDISMVRKYIKCVRCIYIE